MAQQPGWERDGVGTKAGRLRASVPMGLLQGHYLAQLTHCSVCWWEERRGCRQTLPRALPPSPPFLSGFLLALEGGGDDRRGWLALPASPAGTRALDPRGM